MITQSERQLRADGRIADSIRNGPFWADIRPRIERIDFAPDLLNLANDRLPKRRGQEFMSVVDFDGVAVDSSLLTFAGQVIAGVGDFNHISEPVVDAIGLLRRDGPVILTTNRSRVFNRLIESRGATPEAEIISRLGVPPFLDDFDRQNGFRNHDPRLIGRMKAEIKASGFSTQAKNKILRLIFDINDGPITWVNTAFHNAGLPIELNAVSKIQNAAAEMGFQFDKIHLGIIDPRLKEP